jgi:hypothetical protein
MVSQSQHQHIRIEMPLNNLLEHLSPIGWENIILYGEYVLNWSSVQP